MDNEPELIEEYKELEIDGIGIEDLIQVLNNLENEGFTYISVAHHYEWCSKISAVKERLETPKEVQDRLRIKLRAEQREREEYERLRAKYGNVD